MPLRSEGEPGLAVEELAPDLGPLRHLRAPWAGWPERRRLRLGWPVLPQALAFYGLLRGLRVYYQTLIDRQPAFGVSNPDRTALCWMGGQFWQVNGAVGRDLGVGLWRAFLEAGGPRPTEFRLQASPQGGLKPTEARECFLRQGPRCQQLWQLREPRDRRAWA
jgi:hypothetical protein